MSIFSTFPDLKLLLIINTVLEIAIGETRDLVYRCPSGMLCLIESFYTQAELASITINSIKFDGVEYLRASVTQGTTMLQGSMHSVATGSQSVFNLDIPVRSTIIFNVTNTNAAANDFTLKLWARVHNDLKKKFHHPAQHTTLQPTTA